MGKDKVVIIVITTVVFSAIIFGILMAYRTYTLPMAVENIDEAIKMLKYDDKESDDWRMVRLSMYNELSKSQKMRNSHTNEIYKFTKQEMDEIYECIGGKEAVINYLKSIENEEKRREKLELACYQLKIITDDELDKLWNLK